jgi:hypothetical protein
MRMNQDRGRRREWFGQDPKLVQEWLRQNKLIYGGLIAIGVYMVQPFLTAGLLDLSATICVVALSVAIPLLAGLLVLNRQEIFLRVEQGHPPTPPDAEEPDDPEA